MKITQSTNGLKETALSTTSTSVLQRHLSSFMDNNLQAVVSDYTSESVLITREETFTGADEIREFFKELIAQFPKQNSSFELDKLVVRDELAYIIWHGETPTLDIPFATDTFIIKNGKIYQQTFAGDLRLKSQS